MKLRILSRPPKKTPATHVLKGLTLTFDPPPVPPLPPSSNQTSLPLHAVLSPWQTDAPGPPPIRQNRSWNHLCCDSSSLRPPPPRLGTHIPPIPPPGVPDCSHIHAGNGVATPPPAPPAPLLFCSRQPDLRRRRRRWSRHILSLSCYRLVRVRRGFLSRRPSSAFLFISFRLLTRISPTGRFFTAAMRRRRPLRASVQPR